MESLSSETEDGAPGLLGESVPPEAWSTLTGNPCCVEGEGDWGASIKVAF